MAVNQCGTASRLKKIAINRRSGSSRGAVTGTVLHQLLAMDHWPEEADRRVLADSLSESEWKEVLAEAERIRSGAEYLHWSSLSNRHELSFFIEVGGRYLQGSVDWLVLDGSRGVIIDFKSNQIRTTIGDLFKQYDLQFDVYTVAAASLFPDLTEFEQVLFSTKTGQTFRKMVQRREVESIRQNLSHFIHRIEKGEFDRDYRDIEAESCPSCPFHSWCYQKEDIQSMQVLTDD